MTHFVRPLWLILVTIAIGLVLWLVNWLLQRLVLLLVAAMVLAGCGPHLRDVQLEAIDGLDYDARIVWSKT